MKFSEFVCFDALIPQLKAADRDGVITELVSALDKAGRLKGIKADTIAKAVIKRENEASTGMGKGVAVPHVKHPSIKEAIGAVGLSSTGVEFSSLDKQPVYSVILLLSPANEPDKHLQAMEKIFKHLQQDKFRKFLRQCQSSAQIEDLLTESDENPMWS